MDIETGRKIFLLPETYYALIDNIEGDYYDVTFNGVSGKVPKESVSIIGYHTTATGTVREIKVDGKYSVFTEIRLKSTMDGKSEEYEVPTDGSMYFLGKYPADEMWYYVRYNENCGYLKAEYTSQPSIDEGVFTPEILPEEPDMPSEEPTKESSDLTKILVITGVSVAAVALVIIIFIPKKKGTKKYYYEDTR